MGPSSFGSSIALLVKTFQLQFYLKLLYARRIVVECCIANRSEAIQKYSQKMGFT